MTFHLLPLLARSVPGAGIIGGIVGGSATLANNLKARNDGADISNAEIAVNTAKEAAGSGAATALGAVAVGVVGGGLVISLGAAFAASVAGKYAWDLAMERIDDPDSGGLFSGTD